jgi:glucose/mannose-6-phosphate isomerase
MNLDDLAIFQQLDSQNMIEQINNLPQQLSDAWEQGMAQALPAMEGLQNILIAGMGGSAIGADLLAAYAAPLCPLPIYVHRDYDLPAWVRGAQTLVIAVSHSGNTEETLSAFQQAQTLGCRILVVSTGGKLAQLGVESNNPVWLFAHSGQPRAAVGFTFGLLLAALHRLGLLPDPSAALEEALQAMRSQQVNLLREVPAARNPAKRMAGQLVGRAVVVFGADYMAPVARRWKSQISEIAKAWGQFEFLPEADHNTLAGLNHPERLLDQLIAIFLTAPENNPRNQLRLEFTRQIFMTQGINTDTIQARGAGSLAHIWTAMHFGDYTSYYLAAAYGEDPTPVEALTALKNALSTMD